MPGAQESGGAGKDFLPFPTSLLGEYGEERISVVIYASNAAVASLLLLAITWYATYDQRLVGTGLDKECIRHERLRGLAVPVVFVFSIALSFLSPAAAIYSWLLLFFAGRLLRRVWPRR